MLVLIYAFSYVRCRGRLRGRRRTQPPPPAEPAVRTRPHRGRARRQPAGPHPARRVPPPPRAARGGPGRGPPGRPAPHLRAETRWPATHRRLDHPVPPLLARPPRRPAPAPGEPMSDLGTVTTNGDHATLTFERRLPFPIDSVWAAITDPAERAQWFGTTQIADGQIVIEPEDPPAPPEAKRVTGRILTWQPPADGHAVFEHEWRQRIVEDSVVRYELRTDGDATLLTFTHSGLSER